MTEQPVLGKIVSNENNVEVIDLGESVGNAGAGTPPTMGSLSVNNRGKEGEAPDDLRPSRFGPAAQQDIRVTLWGNNSKYV